MTNKFAKPHYDSEFFDEVKITTVPRYKESEISGDEWRTSAYLQLFWKGNLIIERRFRNIETAVAILPSLIILTPESGEATHPQDEFAYCFQPGCGNKAIVEYELKREFNRDGRGWEPLFTKYRRFCDKHRCRGDSSLEDADRNYRLIAEMEDEG